MLLVTFTELAKFLEKRQYKLDRHNADCYKSRLNVILHYFKYRKFTKDNIDLFFIHLEIVRNVSPATKDNYLKILKHICKYRKSKLLDDYTYFNRNREKDPDYDVLTEDEEKKLVKVYFKGLGSSTRECKKINYRYSTAIKVLGLGLRISELTCLEWQDIRTDHIYIKQGKTFAARRKIYITPKLYNSIQLLERFTQHNYVFGSRQGKMSGDVMNKELKKRATAACINKRVTNHSFRHSAINQAVQHGFSDRYIQSHVGHASVRSTQSYIHLGLAESKRIVESSPKYVTKNIEKAKALLKDRIDNIADPDKIKALNLLLNPNSV